jgi:predicted enzyme related to lactoylglutathione lyase
MSDIREELVIPAPPVWMYEAMLDSRRFASLSRAEATGEPVVGGSFSRFGGEVLGTHVELVPSRCIVDAWRMSDWPEGTWSVARLTLESVPNASVYGEGTKLVLELSKVPESRPIPSAARGAPSGRASTAPSAESRWCGRPRLRHVTQTQRRKKMATKNNGNGGAGTVAWFEIAVKDGEELQTFYSRLFGWETAEVAPGADYGVMNASPQGIGGGIGSKGGGRGHVTLFVEVGDPKTTLEQVVRLGGKVIAEPMTFPDKRPSSHGRGEVTFAYVADPKGHVIGLCGGIVRR